MVSMKDLLASIEIVPNLQSTKIIFGLTMFLLPILGLLIAEHSQTLPHLSYHVHVLLCL